MTRREGALPNFPIVSDDEDAKTPYHHCIERAVSTIDRGLMSFFLDEDDQSVVDAALSFVDEFAGAAKVAEDAPGPIPASPRAAKALNDEASHASVSVDDMMRREQLNERKKMLRAAGVYGNSNKVRNNRRIEIAYLREQLEKLQIDLEVLKKQKGEGATCRTKTRAAPPAELHKDQVPSAEGVVATSTPTMSTVWENIADSQRHLEAAWALVMDDLGRADMFVLVVRWLYSQNTECSFFTDNGLNPHVLDLRGDAGEFQGLFRHLDNAYQELDAVFAANGLSDMVVTRSDVHVRDGAGGKYVELFFNKVLPFKLQDATEATWEHFKGSEKHMGNGSVYSKTAKVSDGNANELVLKPHSLASSVFESVVELYTYTHDGDEQGSRCHRASIKHSTAERQSRHVPEAGAVRPALDVANALEVMVECLEDEDDRAFQAALSFVDECVLDEEEVEVAAATRTTALMHREDEWAAMSCGLRPTVNVTGVETSFGALGGYKMASTDLTAPAKGCGSEASNRDKLRRRSETSERKKLLRKAGIYGDANWMSKDSRLEIAYLQERIEKLQLDLQVLQCRKSKRRDIHAGARASSDDAMDAALQIPKVWEVIAIRQQRRLKGAERENLRLKLAVQRQQKVANCMTNVVRKRAGHLTNDCATFMDFSNQEIVRVLRSRGDAGDFPLLFRHMETAHQEVDAVFASNGLANMVLTPSDVHIREGVNGKYLEAFSNKVLPFGLRAATEATWDHFKGSEKHLGNGNIYEKTAQVSHAADATDVCVGSSNDGALLVLHPEP
ncbi:unnamed protein product [Phytophthora fragariaefolia]|uniref:Unnamed protein product n=1 Tax=Phytophthora fragariaefolia TaxID=1490495 RepID=A0A9W6X8P4_9STRA|nr:unnamed protein product [Phytophthora fragariaefolia]